MVKRFRGERNVSRNTKKSSVLLLLVVVKVVAVVVAVVMVADFSGESVHLEPSYLTSSFI